MVANADLYNPCDRTDCDDGNVCTLDRCTSSFSFEPSCRHEPANDDQDCGVDNEVALSCRGGLCGAESLCDGVECNDDDPCTVDTCEWDGECSFTPVDCNDENECTTDSCDSMTGECVHDPVEASAPRICLLTEVPDDNSFPFGRCDEGVCTLPCNPEIEEPSTCPFVDEEWACCPGSEYCQFECP